MDANKIYAATESRCLSLAMATHYLLALYTCLSLPLGLADPPVAAWSALYLFAVAAICDMLPLGHRYGWPRLPSGQYL